jgi:ketosteroid isomerase-like protein
MNHSSRLAVFLVLTSLLISLGCNSAQQPAAPADTRAADEAAIVKFDSDWEKAAQSKQVDAWMAFYTDDAVVLPPNDKIATTKDAIRKPVGDLLGLPGLDIHWKATKVEVAKSGDIAYAYGAYNLTFNGPGGKPASDQGKYLEILKKQADGSWKCSADTWSSDMPPAPPAK